MFATLLRYTLIAADTRALRNWLIAHPGPVAVGRAEVTSADVAAAAGVLTGQQISEALTTPDLTAEQLRAAEAMVLAVCGRTPLAEDARLNMAAARFDPGTPIRLLDYGPAVMAVLREPLDGRKTLCLTHVGADETLAPVPWRQILGTTNVRDLVSGVRLAVHGPSFALGPFETRWLV
jgi:hypothetical protein